MADTAGKMAFLQRQSDETRLQFLRTEVDTCFMLVGIAEMESQNGLSEQARRSVVHAEEGYATLQRFLSDPKHVGRLTGEQQRVFRGQMERLRTKLDELKK